jgi:D-alanyl-D-alanine dipeptidase
MDLICLNRFEPEFKLDIKYATPHNFMGRPVYEAARAFLQRSVAESLRSAHHELKRHGYGILVFDGYRPWSVTKLFWEEATPAMREFLAHPETGSTHNRGCAVDCSLFDLKTGQEIRMPSAFDEMNEKAYANYAHGTADETRARNLLIETMHRFDFSVLKNEWWHFNHVHAPKYPILDLNFAELDLHHRL